jgi:heme-degrading monooxygenase HmoA
VIARIWRGVTRAEHLDEYLDYLEGTGLGEYGEAEGNLGVTVLRRLVGDRAEFVMISYWESMDAVKGFAGEDPDRAVYYAEDDRYHLEKPPTVDHYEVPVDRR